MERGEVQRHFRSQVFQHPFGELAEFARVVVESRDDQVGDFKPNVGLLLQPLQHIQYGLQVSQRNAPVKVFRKCLQVHVGGVDVVVDFVEGVVGDVAIGNHHCVQAVLFGRLADVDHVLAPNGGLVVGEGQRGTSVFEGEQHDVFGRQVGGVYLVVLGLGDIPVLAEETAHVAACRAQ